MSKERLEEIDQVVEDLYNDKIEIREFVQVSLEQAERVQELENILEQDTRQEVLEVMYEENKRYREAIEQVLERLNGTPAERYEIAMVYTDLAKALEGDSHI